MEKRRGLGNIDVLLRDVARAALLSWARTALFRVDTDAYLIISGVNTIRRM